MVAAIEEQETVGGIIEKNTMAQKIRELEQVNIGLELKVEALSETTLKKEHDELQSENTELREAIQRLRSEISILRVDKEQMATSENAFRELNEMIVKENEELIAKVKRLEGRAVVKVDEEIGRKNIELAKTRRTFLRGLSAIESILDCLKEV